MRNVEDTEGCSMFDLLVSLHLTSTVLQILYIYYTKIIISVI